MSFSMISVTLSSDEEDCDDSDKHGNSSTVSSMRVLLRPPSRNATLKLVEYDVGSDDLEHANMVWIFLDLEMFLMSLFEVFWHDAMSFSVHLASTVTVSRFR